MKARLCIGCGRDAGKVCWGYCGEFVCTKCATKVSFRSLQMYGYAFRCWRSIEKADGRGERVNYADVAVQMALRWAKVREELEVTPFPAGLRQHLKEMGW